MLAHIHTHDGITIVSRGRPIAISNDDPIYKEAVGIATSDVSNAENLLDGLLNRLAKNLRNVVKFSSDLEYNAGVILYKGEALHNYAADRLVSMIDQRQDAWPLTRFLEKLQKNVSKTVVDNLYAFLETGGLPLTEDGDFLAYKAVRDTYMDIHSGKFRNRIGDVCEMPRNQVDEDRNRTCSSGLHVCSFDYLPNFSHADGHVMVCKVSPADVVAIPSDYNNTKMRVSRYVVFDEVLNYYDREGRELKTADVLRDMDVVEPGYLLQVFPADADAYANSVYEAEFYTLAEAKLQAERQYNEHADQYETVCVTVEDGDGMTVWIHDEDGGQE